MKLISILAAWLLAAQAVACDLAALIAAAPAGSTITLPAGSYQVAATIVIDKPLRIVGEPGTVIEEASILSPVIRCTADGVWIENLTCRGIETAATYSGDPAVVKERAFIAADSRRGLQLRNIRVSGKSRGVYLFKCQDCLVEDLDMEGLFTAPVAGVNYSSACVVLRGENNRIVRAVARHTGSVVLGGDTTLRLSVTGWTGSDLYDNGVYISSGMGCLVEGGSCRRVGRLAGGSGVKVRGSHHRVIGNYIEDALGHGLAVSGNGVDDGTGHNGRCTTVTGNVVLRSRASGIALYLQDGFPPRDCIVTGNAIEGYGSPTYPPITNIGTGHLVGGNIEIQ